MSKNSAHPKVIDGGMHVDARGMVTFVNDFHLSEVDRVYAIHAHQANRPRGWVGHQREQKWFWVIQGVILIAVVKPDNWEDPAKNLPVKRFALSAVKPQVLHIPAGYATGSVGLTYHSTLMVFSTGRIEDVRSDDYRFSPDTWPIVDDL